MSGADARPAPPPLASIREDVARALAVLEDRFEMHMFDGDEDLVHARSE